MGMRRTIAALPVGRQHRHSQPASAPKATISTTNMSSATVMGRAPLLAAAPPAKWSRPLGLVSEFRVSLSLSVQLRGITLKITGSRQGPVS
jgi:hypothetical protein